MRCRTLQAAAEHILPQLLTSMMHRGLVLDELGPDARHAWEPGSHAMWMGLARTPGSQVVRRLDIKASVEALGWDRGGLLSEHEWWEVAAAAILSVMAHSTCATCWRPCISAACADLPALCHALCRQLLCLGAGGCMRAGQSWAVVGDCCQAVRVEVACTQQASSFAAGWRESIKEAHQFTLHPCPTAVLQPRAAPLGQPCGGHCTSLQPRRQWAQAQRPGPAAHHTGGVAQGCALAAGCCRWSPVVGLQLPRTPPLTGCCWPCPSLQLQTTPR